LTFDVNGATGSINAIEFTDEATIPDASVLTYANYAFLGWSTNQDATTAQYTAGSKYTGKSATLYAVWTPIYKIIYHYDPKVPATKAENSVTGVDFANGNVKIHYEISLNSNQILVWKDKDGKIYTDEQVVQTAGDIEVWAYISENVEGEATSEGWQYKQY